MLVVRCLLTAPETALFVRALCHRRRASPHQLSHNPYRNGAHQAFGGACERLPALLLGVDAQYSV